MTTLSVPNRYLALTPIFVTSPTTRCGTTLVQRLICASDNAFVFGEDAAQHINLLMGMFVNFMQHLEAHGADLDCDFQRALAGELRDWRPGLLPPSDVMLRGWTETFYQLPLALAEFARSIGRPIWGLKRPGFTRDTIVALLALMPRAKIIYVVRKLPDALQSAKARKFAVGEDETEQYCAGWATNVQQVLALQSEKVMLLRFEDLVADRSESVAAIEAFTGAQGVDAREFDLKINTFAGEEANGFSPTQYIAPAALSVSDRSAVARCGGAMMARLYGQS